MRPSLRQIRLRQTWLHPSLLRGAPQNIVPHRFTATFAQNSQSIDIPKLTITPGSAYHNSLPSFLEYAKRVNLAPWTNTFVGTHYEYTTAVALMRLGFSLIRVGRKQDGGIDLIGHWILAPLREPLPIIIQCKALKTAIGPSYVRELEGAFRGIPADWRKKDVLALLVSTIKATNGVLEALRQSERPMGFLLVSKKGMVRQFVWNRAACEKGLEGVGVTMRHTPRALITELDDWEEDDDEGATKKMSKRMAKFKNAGTEKDIQLTWMGSPIFPERQMLYQETLKLTSLIVPDEDDAELVESRASNEIDSSSSKAVTEKGRTPENSEETDMATPTKRGRPKGSKNKPKDSLDID